mgnify:CR=1 FL=1
MLSMHLAVADPQLVDTLLERGCTAIDFVSIQDDRGHLPVLRPLSQIAGRMVPQIASRYLQTDHGGQGILLGGAPAVPPAEVVVLGAGPGGYTAAFRAADLGFGSYEGVGYRHVRLALAAILIMGVGVPLLTVPKRDRFP